MQPNLQDSTQILRFTTASRGSRKITTDWIHVTLAAATQECWRVASNIRWLASVVTAQRSPSARRRSDADLQAAYRELVQRNQMRARTAAVLRRAEQRALQA